MEEIENEPKQEERVVDAEITECPLGTKLYMSDIFKTSIIIQFIQFVNSVNEKETKTETEKTVRAVGKDENENLIHDFHRIEISGDDVMSVRFLNIL